MLFGALVLPVLAALAAAAPAPAEGTLEPRAVSSFDRFFMIVLENRDFDKVMKDTYMGTTLPAKGRLLTNMHALTHPSQPNYIGMISGSTKGVILDLDGNIDRRNVVDLLEAKGITWASYQENYPGGCFTDSKSSDGLYRRKHNPFISFTNIAKNPKRCENIVNAEELEADIKANTVPQFVFYTPNMNNDGHDTDAATASRWLFGFLEPKLKDPVFKNTVFYITFDENEWLLPWFNDNKIYSLFVGGPIAPGTTDNTKYDHYSILATLQARWGLGNLGQGDVGATPFNI